MTTDQELDTVKDEKHMLEKKLKVEEESFKKRMALHEQYTQE